MMKLSIGDTADGPAMDCEMPCGSTNNDGGVARDMRILLRAS